MIVPRFTFGKCNEIFPSPTPIVPLRIEAKRVQGNIERSSLKVKEL
jgi:hypothetical protein